ncbi:hypothetical protein [Ravibacter arvi]
MLLLKQKKPLRRSVGFQVRSDLLQAGIYPVEMTTTGGLNQKS